MKGFFKQWEHGDSPVLWIEMICSGDSKKMKELLGFNFGGHCFVSQNQKTAFFKNLKIAAIAKRFGEKKYTNAKFVTNFCQRAKQAEKELRKFCARFKKIHLKIKNNKQLIKIFQEFFNKHSILYAYYRFSRQDFYQGVIDKFKKRYRLDEHQFSLLLEAKLKSIDLPVADRKIMQGLKAVGAARFSMHKTWGWAYKQGEVLFKEIGRRLGLSSLQVQNCASVEIIRFLRGGKIDEKKINERLNSFKFISYKKGFKIVSPWQENDNKEKEQNQVRGVVAYGGKARGRVSLIRESLSGTARRLVVNMPKGNILITEMTSPDMVPAMKKAGAIVTDDGGLLYHAAIVARELKKPCVISTGKATKIFKNGDLVEVNAGSGVVKILKR